MGGHDEGKTYQTCEKLNLKSLRWESFPSLKFKRWSFAACVTDNYIYCFGGNGGGDDWGSLSKCERYDSTSKEWVEIASMHRERTELGCASHEGYIYVVGGQTSGTNLQSKSLHEMEIYDPQRDLWTLIYINEFAVTAPQLVFLGNELHVIGGRNEKGQEHCLVWIYELNDKNWKRGEESLKKRAAATLCYVPLKIE